MNFLIEDISIHEISIGIKKIEVLGRPIHNYYKNLHMRLMIIVNQWLSNLINQFEVEVYLGIGKIVESDKELEGQ